MRRSVKVFFGLGALVACTNEMRFFPVSRADPGVQGGAGTASGTSGGGTGGSVQPGAGAAGAAGAAAAGAAAAGAPQEAGGAAGNGGAGASNVGAPAPVGPSGDWLLTFQEECDAGFSPLWYTYWSWQEPRTQPHTGEYVADERVTLAGGHCMITADDTPNGDRSYTSGTLNTASRFEQEFGYFEARLKVPVGIGLWTDWRLRTRAGWPPAIDVCNVFGRDPDTAQFAHYWGDLYPNHTPWIMLYSAADLSQAFHVYGVEWSASELIWYVDGVERARTQEGTAQQVGQRFLSLAIMVGTGEDPAEPPDLTTQWPVELRIDWVRAWQRP